MNWIAVSYYTIGTGYEAEIQKLRKSLEGLNIDHKIYATAPAESWRANLNFKSAFILKALEEFQGRDIVFIDADGIVRSWPALFDELSAKHEYDIAAHFFQYSFEKDELLSGTLWIQNNAIGRAIVDRWHELGLRWPSIRHQKCLKVALQKLQGEAIFAKVFRLPIEYTCIFDHPARRGKTAVIEHFQASRKYRREVGYGVSLIRRPAKGIRPRSIGIVRPGRSQAAGEGVGL